MKNFNTKRMWQVLKYDLLINRKQNLTILATMALVLFIIFFFMFINHAWYYPDGRVGEIGEGNAVMVLLLGMATTVFYGSWFFRHMDTKQHRISYLMLPASPAEKMVARLLITVVVMPLAIMVAIVTADMLRWFIHIILGVGLSGSVTFPTLKFISYAPWQATVFMVLLTLWAQSLYILGGALFTRRQWLLTGTSLILIAMAGSRSLVRTLDYMFDQGLNKGFTIDGDMLFWVSTCAFIAFSLLNYWLSYLIFRRTQVINNKWLNL